MCLHYDKLLNLRVIINKQLKGIYWLMENNQIQNKQKVSSAFSTLPWLQRWKTEEHDCEIYWFDSSSVLFTKAALAVIIKKIIVIT